MRPKTIWQALLSVSQLHSSVLAPLSCDKEPRAPEISRLSFWGNELIMSLQLSLHLFELHPEAPKH